MLNKPLFKNRSRSYLKLFSTGLFLTVALTACGWHLRGSLALPESLSSVYVLNQARAVELGSALEDLLKANNVTLSPSASDAQLIITLDDFSEKSRTATLSSGGRVSEYELTSEVGYEIEDRLGNTLIPASEASVLRVYQYDENNVMASTSEKRTLQQEMRRELAQQILRRLRFIDLPKTSGAAP